MEVQPHLFSIIIAQHHCIAFILFYCTLLTVLCKVAPALKMFHYGSRCYQELKEEEESSDAVHLSTFTNSFYDGNSLPNGSSLCLEFSF